MQNPGADGSLSRGEVILRSLLFLFLILMFLSAVKMFGEAAQMLTHEYETSVNALMTGMSNPFIGLCIGIFATALMNSSSATTSLAVAMVASGIISIENAVAIVIGANIGASITSMMVSMGNITDKRAFIRGFSVAFIQDWYSLSTAAVCFVLEYGFHFLSGGATFLSRILTCCGSPSCDGGSWLCNPLPLLVDSPVKAVQKVLVELLNFPVTAAAVCMGILGLAVLFFALVNMTKNMKVLMADKVEEWINSVLSKNGYLGLLIGWIVTMIIQSSGITTSLLVPLVAAGILQIRTAYPLILGAKLGTPITGVLAALAFLGTPAGTNAMAIALVHFLFNAVGVALWYPLPFLRFPVFLTERFSPVLGTHRAYVVCWMVGVFFIIPVVGIFLFR